VRLAAQSTKLRVSHWQQTGAAATFCLAAFHGRGISLSDELYSEETVRV